MINGEVNSRLEAVVTLQVEDMAGNTHEIKAIVDTGFGGFLTLPTSAIRSFELKSTGRQRGLLADGNSVFFDVYSGDVIWDGKKRRIDFHAADAESLVSVAMLAGSRLTVDLKRGGKVCIESLA